MNARQRTGASMQARNCCSRSIHPCAACPEEAQHPACIRIEHQRLEISEMPTVLGGTEENAVLAPSTEDMIPTHGFASVLLGRRTRSLVKGGRRGAVVTLAVPLGGGIGVLDGVSAAELYFSNVKYETLE